MSLAWLQTRFFFVELRKRQRWRECCRGILQAQDLGRASFLSVSELILDCGPAFWIGLAGEYLQCLFVVPNGFLQVI